MESVSVWHLRTRWSESDISVVRLSDTYQLVRKYHTDTLSMKYSVFLQFFYLGGVLEENEVFNNRFDGICLATGVEPQLSSKLTSLLFSSRSVRHCCFSN